jgi:hypothetical protein
MIRVRVRYEAAPEALANDDHRTRSAVSALPCHRAEHELGDAVVPVRAHDEQARVAGSGEQRAGRVGVDDGLGDLARPDLPDDLADEAVEPLLAFPLAALHLDPAGTGNLVVLPECMHDLKRRPPAPRLRKREAERFSELSEPSTPTTIVVMIRSQAAGGA